MEMKKRCKAGGIGKYCTSVPDLQDFAAKFKFVNQFNCAR